MDGKPLMHVNLRWTVRFFILAATLMLLWAGPIPFHLQRLLPGFSPLALLGGWVWLVPSLSWIWWLAPPVALIVLAVWRGRFFCRWFCPAGTLLAVGTHRTYPVRRYPHFSGSLFWMLLGSALAGAPLGLWLDPLSSFQRLGLFASRLYGIAALIPGLLLPGMLILGFFQPGVWCSALCPLGYLFHLLRLPAGRHLPDVERRRLLVGLGLGVPLGIASRFGVRSVSGKSLPLLPPGAALPETYSVRCSRCYACVRVCPSGFLRVAFRFARSPLQWFQPEGDPDVGACLPLCYACSKVCPTGAIAPLDLATKHNLQMGQAEILSDACLAWHDGINCLLCATVCPYEAIEAVAASAGVLAPVIHLELCRGCGACKTICPASRIGKAIRVVGVPRQQHVRNEL